MCADDVIPINNSSMWNAQLNCHQQKLFWLWGLYLRLSRPSLVSPYKRKPGHFRPSLLAVRIQLLLLFSAITTLNLGKTKRSLKYAIMGYELPEVHLYSRAHLKRLGFLETHFLFAVFTSLGSISLIISSFFLVSVTKKYQQRDRVLRVIRDR